MRDIVVVKHLKDLSRGKRPEDARSGLCIELLNRFGIGSSRITMHIAQYWSEYSGDRLYPIPHTKKTPREAYMIAARSWSGNWSLWKIFPSDREYVRSRRRLCAWLAKEIEEGRLVL